jgi:hypothetical protein
MQSFYRLSPMNIVRVFLCEHVSGWTVCCFISVCCFLHPWCERWHMSSHFIG